MCVEWKMSAMTSYLHSAPIFIPFGCQISSLNLCTLCFPDHRQIARQSAVEHFFVFIASWNMSNGARVSSLASNGVRHTSLEKCFVASGGVWIARGFIGIASVADSNTLRCLIAIHRAANWIDHAYGAARIGRQMSESNAYALGFFNR